MEETSQRVAHILQQRLEPLEIPHRAAILQRLRDIPHRPLRCEASLIVRQSVAIRVLRHLAMRTQFFGKLTFPLTSCEVMSESHRLSMGV